MLPASEQDAQVPAPSAGTRKREQASNSGAANRRLSRLMGHLVRHGTSGGPTHKQHVGTLTLAQFNSAGKKLVVKYLMGCCTSSSWVRAVAAARPYTSVPDLISAATAAWFRGDQSMWEEGFRGHAALGTAAAEQNAAVQDSPSDTKAQLVECAQAYERKLGRRCIVFAAGKSVSDMLRITRARLQGDRNSELRRCLEQTAQITALRLAKLFVNVSEQQLLQVSPVTTHILDTSRGCPAANVEVQLSFWDAETHTWQPRGSGFTNADGRVVDLLPGFFASNGIFETGRYKIAFDVAQYYRDLDAETFYPAAAIEFNVRSSSQHYHVPLLLNPFGYTTYRGS